MIPEYNIVTIGGRGFGKTALIGAMMRVPGFLPVVGAQSVDDFNKGGLGGALEPTAVDAGIEKFEFECSDPNRFKLNFVDYAGELAQGYDSRDESAGARLDFASWKRRSIEKELHRAIQCADALMILLPANWEALDTELEALKGKIKRWINNLDTPRPIYVVVNKCDLMSSEKFGRIKSEKDVKDFVLSDPNCERIHSKIVEAVKVNESWGVQSVEQIHYVMMSIYPRVDGEWVTEENRIRSLNEANASPHGLKDLVLEMVNTADEVRAHNLMSAWNENAGGVKKWFKRFLKRMFYFPFKSRGLVRKGSVNADLYKQMRGIWLSASWRFGVFSAVVVAAVIGSWVFVNWTQEAYSEYAFGQELEREASRLSLKTSERLVGFEEYFEDSTWVRSLFFSGNISQLKAQLESLKTNYVEWLELDMTNQLADTRVAKMDCWEVEPKVNSERSDKRMQIITNHLARLPKDRASAAIVKTKLDEETYRNSAEADKEFESALYALKDVDLHKKCREMVSVKSRFAEKKNSRKNDFERLGEEIVKLECALSNELDTAYQRIAKANLGEAWEVSKVRMQKQQECITNSLTWFVEGSAAYKKWESEANRLAVQIAGNEHYGPFDVAFNELMADCSNGRLLRFAEFEEKWPRVNYQDRKSKFDELDRLRQAVIAGLTNRVANAEETYCDNSELQMSVRIEKTKQRIGEYEAVRKEFVTSGGEYVWASQKIESAQKWITDHQKYAMFEDELASVEIKKERERVNPLEAFLRDHTREAYPEYTDRIAKLEEQKDELNKRLMAEVRDEIAMRTNESATATWQKQTNVLDRCRMVIAGYKTLVDMSSQEELRKDSETLGALSDRLVRNGMFDDELASVTNASRRRLVKRIQEFRETFKAKDYQDRADAYALLHTMETNLVAQIAVTNRAVIAVLPKPKDKDFEGWRDRYQKICEACDVALESLPTNHVAATEYVVERNKARQAVQKYTRWIEFVKEADRIVNDDKAELTVRLMSIGAFWKEVHDEKVLLLDPVLEAYKNSVRKAQYALETKLAEMVEKELTKYEVKGNASNKEIQNSIAGKIRCINQYHRYFVEHSPMWNKYDLLRGKLDQDLSDEKRKQMFQTAENELLKNLRSTGNAENKIGMIKAFLSAYPSRRYPEFRAKIDDWDRKVASLEVEAKWEKLSAKVKTELADIPKEDENDYKSKMNARRAILQNLLEEVGPYGNQEGVSHLVSDVVTALKRAIEEVDQRIGNGSWQEILRLERAYLKNPTAANYKEYKDALNVFDVKKRGNEGREEQCQKKKEQLAKDKEICEDLLMAYAGFKKKPNANTFSALERKVSNWRNWNQGDPGYGAVRKNFDELSLWIDQIRDLVKFGIEISAEWIGFDVTGSDLDTSFEDHKMELFVNDESIVTIGDVGPNRWTKADHYKIAKGHSLRFRTSISFGQSMGIRMQDHAWTMIDCSSEGEITLWQLLAEDSDSFDKTIALDYTRKGSNKPKARITLRFDGIPVCPTCTQVNYE